MKEELEALLQKAREIVSQAEAKKEAPKKHGRGSGERASGHNYGFYKNYVVKAIQENGSVTSTGLMKQLGISSPTANRILLRMFRSGTIGRHGDGEFGKPYTYVLRSGTQIAEPSVDADETDSENVLQYVSDHLGERYSISGMAEAIGIPRSAIYNIWYKLEKKGLIPKNANMGSVADCEETPGDEPVEHNEVTLYEYIDALVWEHLKATGSVNVLDFLRFVEDKYRNAENV